RVGVGMISRGEVGLIVAGYGLTERLIGRDVFSAAVLVVLATTMATPPLLRLVFTTREAAHGLIEETIAGPPHVPRSLVHDLTDALIALGVLRIRLAEVSGYTDGIEQERLYRGRRLLVQLVQEVEMEALIPHDALDQAVDTTMATI